MVFRFPVEPDKDFIKRTVAVAGDKVEIRNKKVWINDEAVPVRGVFDAENAAEEDSEKVALALARGV